VCEGGYQVTVWVCGRVSSDSLGVLEAIECQFGCEGGYRVTVWVCGRLSSNSLGVSEAIE
jgi:hypothetical protein